MALVVFFIPRHHRLATLATTLSAAQTFEWHKCFTELSIPAQNIQHQSASDGPVVQTCFEISTRCHGWSRQGEPKTNQSFDTEVTEGRGAKYRGKKWPIYYSCEHLGVSALVDVVKLHQKQITLHPKQQQVEFGRDWKDVANAINDVKFNDKSSLLQHPSPTVSLLLKSDYHFPLLETRQLRRLWKSLLTRFLSLVKTFFIFLVGGVKNSTLLGHVCACVCV